MRRRLLGNEHADVAKSLNNLAIVLYEKGDFAEAEALHREALAMRRRLLGNEHPDVATSLNNLANMLHSKGDLRRGGGAPIARPSPCDAGCSGTSTPRWRRA